MKHFNIRDTKTQKQINLHYAAKGAIQDSKQIKQMSYNSIIIHLSIHIQNDLVDVIDLHPTRIVVYGISRLLIFCLTFYFGHVYLFLL